MDTDFVPGRSREQFLKTVEKLPLAHVTQPDDVACAVVACAIYLTSSTGIVVPVDEGDRPEEVKAFHESRSALSGERLVQSAFQAAEQPEASVWCAGRAG